MPWSILKNVWIVTRFHRPVIIAITAPIGALAQGTKGNLRKMEPFISGYASLVLMTLVLLWVLPWKGIALWKAARHGHRVWFIVLLVVNTLALLEILYIFIFSGRHNKLRTSVYRETEKTSPDSERKKESNLVE